MADLLRRACRPCVARRRAPRRSGPPRQWRGTECLGERPLFVPTAAVAETAPVAASSAMSVLALVVALAALGATGCMPRADRLRTVAVLLAVPSWVPPPRPRCLPLRWEALVCQPIPPCQAWAAAGRLGLAGRRFCPVAPPVHRRRCQRRLAGINPRLTTQPFPLLCRWVRSHPCQQLRQHRQATGRGTARLMAAVAVVAAASSAGRVQRVGYSR